MRKIYFVFKNMKEAEYNWRGLAYYLPNEKDFNDVKAIRGPQRIITSITKKEKLNFLKRILIKLNIIKPKFYSEPTEIYFKSEKSDLTGIHKDIYYFLEDEYDACYFIDLLKGI